MVKFDATYYFFDFLKIYFGKKLAVTQFSYCTFIRQAGIYSLWKVVITLCLTFLFDIYSSFKYYLHSVCQDEIYISKLIFLFLISHVLLKVYWFEHSNLSTCENQESMDQVNIVINRNINHKIHTTFTYKSILTVHKSQKLATFF